MRPLTTHVARLLVAAVAAAIPTGAHDRRRPAAAVAAPQRTVGLVTATAAAAAATPLLRCSGIQSPNATLPVVRTGEESLHRSRNRRRAADQRRFVAAVTARDNRIAELVLGQALAAATAERVRRAAA